MFKININTGNAAFCDPYTGEEDEFAKEMEIERIMSEIENAMSEGRKSGSCMEYSTKSIGMTLLAAWDKEQAEQELKRLQSMSAKQLKEYLLSR